MKPSLDFILSKLTRVTSSGLFIPEIDGLRFFAIAFVIAHHINGYLLVKSPLNFPGRVEDGILYNIANKGWYGVELFFVISGCILSLPFAATILEGRTQPSLKNYFSRRLQRLEPPYIINLVFLFIVLIVLNGKSASSLLPHFFASATYLHNIIYQDGSTINYVAWSLEVEIQFYLLAPLLAQVFRVRNRVIRISTFILLPVLIGLISYQLGILSRLNILGNIQYFILGFILTDILLVNKIRAKRQTYYWDIVAPIAATVIILILCTRDYAEYVKKDFLPLTYLLPYLLLACCLAAFRGRIWNKIVTNKWLVTIGGMCYTIYLYHFAIIPFFGRIFIKLSLTQSYEVNLLLQWLLYFPTIFLICAVLFILFEKPFMRKNWASHWRNLIPIFQSAPKQALSQSADINPG